MNPLVIAGGISECLNHFLTDVGPFAMANEFADMGGQVIEGNLEHGILLVTF